MKTKRILILLLAVLAMGAVSCKKYEDGPTFSLASKKGRVAGEWTVESASYVDNGTTVDVTEDLKAEITKLELTKDGDGKLYEGTDYESFKWEFNDDKEKLVFIWDGNYKEEYEIRRLKQKELWIRVSEGNGMYTEIHFQQ